MLYNVILNICLFFKKVNYFFKPNCFLSCCVNYDVNKITSFLVLSKYIYNTIRHALNLGRAL